MFLSSPCEKDESLCRWVYDQTDNRTLANVVDRLIGLPLAILGLVGLGLVLRLVFHRLVDRLVSRAGDGVLPDQMSRLSLRRRRPEAQRTSAAHDLAISTRRVQRAKTMGDLLKSVITGVLVAVFGTMILSQLGVNIAPIIASAGIIGIALGFGAQSLVKDFLSGVFMIFEDQFGVGDIVDVGEASGTVEAVSLRVTRLRDLDGTVWYVPNGEILRVGNKSQNWSRAVVDVGVGYAEDLVRAKRVLAEVAHDLWEDDDYRSVIIEEPEVTGVEALAADAITLRVLVKTAPMEQWAVARELRQRIKARFDHEGIEIPFPQRVVWHRDGPPRAADQHEAQHEASTTARTSRSPRVAPRLQAGPRVGSGQAAQVRQLRSGSSGPAAQVRQLRSGSSGPAAQVRQLRSGSSGPAAQVRQLRSGSSGPAAQVRQLRSGSSGQGRVEGDRGAGQRLADRAVRLGVLGGGGEVLGAHARHAPADRQPDLGDPLAGDEVDLGGGVQRGRGRPGLGQPVGEGHREAGGVCGADELLGAGLPVRLLGAGRPGDVVGPEPGALEGHLAGALEEAALPVRGRCACGRHARESYRRPVGTMCG